MTLRLEISKREPLNFQMTYCLSILIKALMVKSCRKCKQTNIGTGDGLTQVNGLNGWRNLSDQTGEITNRNIRSNQSGVYELKINTSSLILHRKLHITVTGKMKTVSVTEGEPIILLTGLIEIRGYDLILWKFGEHLIAEINKSANQFLPHDTSDERFEGRLQPSEQSGSLTIRDSRTTDSGVYHLNMSSSSHTIQRSISVTVSVPDKPTPDPGLSPGAVTGIVAVVQMLVFAVVIFAGVIYHRRKISEVKGRKYLEKNGTNDPLKTETDSSD